MQKGEEELEEETPQMVEFRSWQRKDENPISTHHSTIFPGAHYDDMARDTGTGTVTGTGSNQTTESEEEMKNRMFLNFDTTNRFTEESLSFTSAEELTVLASTRGNVFAGGMSQMQYSLASLVSTPLTDPLSFFSPMEQAPFGSNDNLSGNARKNPVGKPLSKRPRSQLSEECLQIIKKYKKNDLSVSPTPLNMQDLEARRSARSNPREWRILQHNLTKDEALEVLKYHRWKEPVTNAPKGAGCRVSQCGLHSGCQHLLKMRLTVNSDLTRYTIEESGEHSGPLANHSQGLHDFIIEDVDRMLLTGLSPPDVLAELKKLYTANGNLSLLSLLPDEPSKIRHRKLTLMKNEHMAQMSGETTGLMGTLAPISSSSNDSTAPASHDQMQPPTPINPTSYL